MGQVLCDFGLPARSSEFNVAISCYMMLALVGFGRLVHILTAVRKLSAAFLALERSS